MSVCLSVSNVCLYVCKNMLFMYVCMYVCLYACMYVWMDVCMYVCLLFSLRVSLSYHQCMYSMCITFGQFIPNFLEAIS